MKAILFITLFMLVSLETTEQSSDVDFYKCLLLDSDVVFNHLNSLVEAILSNKCTASSEFIGLL